MADALPNEPQRCAHWRDIPVPTHRTGLTTLGGCPYCEIEQLRQAIRKVRAHTAYRPHCPRGLLEGLLASIFRIADAAEHGTSSPGVSDSPWKRPAEKLPERGVAVLLAWKRGPTWAYAVGKYTGKRWLEVEPDTVNEQFVPPDYWRPLDRPCIEPPT